MMPFVSILLVVCGLISWYFKQNSMHLFFTLLFWLYFAVTSACSAWSVIDPSSISCKRNARALNQVPLLVFFLIASAMAHAFYSTNFEVTRLAKFALIFNTFLLVGVAVNLIRNQHSIQKRCFFEADLNIYLAQTHGLPIPEQKVIDESLHGYIKNEFGAKIFLANEWQKSRASLLSLAFVLTGCLCIFPSMLLFWSEVFHEEPINYFRLTDVLAGAFFIYEAIDKENKNVKSLLFSLARKEKEHEKQVSQH